MLEIGRRSWSRSTRCYPPAAFAVIPVLAMAWWLSSPEPMVRRIPVAEAETLVVTIAGNGPPVLLLPGLFGGAYTFRHLAPLLASQGFETLIVEPLGLGESPRPARADYSLTAQARRVAAVLDSLTPGPVLVVAHSLGASIAFRLAYHRPDLVAGIVSLEGGPTEEIGTPAFRRAMRWAPLLRLVGGAALIRRTIRKELESASGDRHWITDQTVKGYTQAADRDLGSTLRAYRAMARTRESELLHPHLAALSCPVLLLVGTAPHDGGVDPDEVTLLEQRVRGFSVDSVPGAGHYLQEEQPDAVAAAVRRLHHLVTSEPAAPRPEVRPCA
jgi:pimeloyl-ACP methyl ester carboxylesterase